MSRSPCSDSRTHLNDDESVHEQHADERVLAGEEHVGVAEDSVLDDEQQAQHEERAVLHKDGHDDADHVRRADDHVRRAAGVARVGRHRGDALAARRLRRREHHRELQHAPRPDAQDHLAQVPIVLHLHSTTFAATR